MQISFSLNETPSVCEVSLDRKVGTIYKTFRPRTITFEKGVLKCSNEGVAKGEDSLLGATVFATAGSNDVKIKLQGKKDPILFRTKSAKETEIFVDQVRKSIRSANVIGLQHGCREPEVVEWYYQYQSDLTRDTAFMLGKTLAVMCHSLPGQDESRKTYFHITLENDRSGLCFRLDKTSNDGAAPSRFAALYNGRIIHLSDITGAYLPGGKFEANRDGLLTIVLLTKEDELTLEFPGRGVEWLIALQALVTFNLIPAPSSRTLASPPGTYTGEGSQAQALLEFSANSGAVFTAASDVQLILQNLSMPGQSPQVEALAEIAMNVLRTLPEVRCNRDATILLGERIEEVIRVIGSPDTGIIRQLKDEAQRQTFDAKMDALTASLQEVHAYIKIQRYSGWLRAHVESSATPKSMFDTLDASIMAHVNKLIYALSLSDTLMFEKKEYVCAVNVRQSVESLGGLDAIYNDSIKERSLAKLAQADGAEITRELARMNGVVFSASQKTFSTTMSSTGEDPQEVRRKGASCWSWFWSWCGDSGAAKPSKSNHKKAHPSLQEPLVS